MTCSFSVSPSFVTALPLVASTHCMFTCAVLYWSESFIYETLIQAHGIIQVIDNFTFVYTNKHLFYIWKCSYLRFISLEMYVNDYESIHSYELFAHNSQRNSLTDWRLSRKNRSCSMYEMELIKVEILIKSEMRTVSLCSRLLYCSFLILIFNWPLFILTWYVLRYLNSPALDGIMKRISFFRAWLCYTHSYQESNEEFIIFQYVNIFTVECG